MTVAGRARPGTTLWEDVGRHAQEAPDSVAVVDGDGSYTYRETAELSRRLAGHYRERGVSRGAVVAVQLPPCRQFIPAFLAAELLGAIVCPLLPSIDGEALTTLLRVARPRLLVTVGRLGSSKPLDAALAASAGLGMEVLAHGAGAAASDSLDRLLLDDTPVEVPDEGPRLNDVAELAFTSGTTGTPKGVLHSHATATAGILSTIRWQEVTAEDVIHMALPVGHNFGYFYGVRLALHAGARLVLQQRWDAGEMVELAGRHRATVSLGPPTFLADLLDIRDDWDGGLDTLCLFTCGGAKLSEQVAMEAVRRFPGRISKAFGMTEIGHTCSTGPDAPDDKVVQTEGRPHPEIEMRILSPDHRPLPDDEVGAVAFRGPFLFLGYHGETESPFLDDGFFLTGDLGLRDESGYLVVTGRTKNLIIRGGENIPAEPVEGVLLRHPAVLDAAVVAVPDRRLGERPVACLALESGERMTIEVMGEFLASEGVPQIHRPEAIMVMTGLPRTETGKLHRARLREEAARADLFGEKEDAR